MKSICFARWTISTCKTIQCLNSAIWSMMTGGRPVALSFFTLEMKETSRGFATIQLVQTYQCCLCWFSGQTLRASCGTLLHSSKPCWYFLNTVTMAPACPLVTRVLQYEVILPLTLVVTHWFSLVRQIMWYTSVLNKH